MLLLRGNRPSPATVTQVVGGVGAAVPTSVVCASASNGAKSVWIALLQTASDLLASVPAAAQPEMHQQLQQQQHAACRTLGGCESSSAPAGTATTWQSSAGLATAAAPGPRCHPGRLHNLTPAPHGPEPNSWAARLYSTAPQVQQEIPKSDVAPPAVVVPLAGLARVPRRSGIQAVEAIKQLGVQVSQHSVQLLELDAGLSHKKAVKCVSAATKMAVKNGLMNRGEDYDITAQLNWLKKWGLKELGPTLMISPGLLGTPIQRLDGVVQLLQSEAGCSAEDICTMLERGPLGFIRAVEKLQPLIHLLRNDLLEPEQLAHVLRKFPKMLLYNVDTPQRNLEFLREIGVPQSALARVLVKFPQILQLSPEQNLKPTINYFLQLGLTTDDIPGMLLRCPTIFGTSVIANLQPTIQFLADEVGIEPEQLPRLITQCPDLLGRRVASLRAKLAHLLLLGIPQEDIATVVTRFPQLLRLSLTNDNYSAKLDWLRTKLGMDVSVLRKVPSYLGYSLEGRIIPRTEFLQANQRPIPNALGDLVCITDADFCSRVAKLPLDEFEAFKVQRQRSRPTC